jgi:carbamate kinase
MHMPSPIRRADAAPVVVAVGGNALTKAGERGSWRQIAAHASAVAAPLAELVRAGRRVAVVHGNGPQVGNLALQQDAAERAVPAQPLHLLCAMTQGQLGSVLVRAIDRLCGAGVAVALVTHVDVDLDDPAFASPSKPIGPFLERERAEQLARELGWQVGEDAGRGYRRLVPSPRPAAVIELGAISALLAAGHVVLAAGGGGVAVANGVDGPLSGVDAVVDKDHASVRLATALGARELCLLTGVDSVQLEFGTPRQRPAHRLTPEEAERHLAEGQFPAGSMGPKVGAALQFLQDGGDRVVITSPARLSDAVAGRPDAGTSIERQRARPRRVPVGGRA